MYSFRPIPILAAIAVACAASAQNCANLKPHRQAPQTGYFIENRGQWEPGVKFLAQSAGVDSWVMQNGVVYDFHKYDTSTAKPKSKYAKQPSGPGKRSGDVVKVTFAGAQPIETIPGKELPGKLNFFIGKDRSKWATGVRRFAEARTEEIYKGISARYYFENGKPRYDLVVSPGANPAQVRMRFDGAQRVAMSKTGVLDIETSVGTVEEKGLYAYQIEGGSTRQVACRMAANGSTVRFNMGDYDRSKPLVIDPLIFSTFLGGNNYEQMAAVAVDSSGDIYEGGDTSSFDFPTTAGAYQNTDNVADQNNTTCFLAKLSSDGSTLLAATYLGSSYYDNLNGMALDSSGNVCITGFSGGTDFPVTPGAFQPTNLAGLGGFTAFVSKLPPNLDALTYSTYLGGSNGSIGYAIAVDSLGNAVVTGNTSSSDFPIRTHIEPTYNSNFGTAFVTDFDPTGNMRFSTYLGGSYFDVGLTVAFDSTGDAIVAGTTDSSDFPVRFAYQSSDPVSQGTNSGFITKFNGLGTGMVFSTYLGGSQSSNITVLALDSTGNVYVTGPTGGGFPITPGAFQTTFASSGGANAFVTKLNPACSALIYSTYLGGSGNDACYGLAVDSAGEAVAAGIASSTDFPTTPGSFEPTFPSDPGTYTVTVSKLSASGAQLLYSTYLGGVDGFEQTNGVALDSAGDAVVAGNVNNGTFPVTPGVFQPTWHGSKDTFITKLGFSVPTTVTVTVAQRVDGGTVPNGTVVKLLNNDGTPLSPPQSATTSSGVATFSSPPAPSGSNTSYEVVVSVPSGGKGLPAVLNSVAPGSSPTIYMTELVPYVSQALIPITPVAFATCRIGSVSQSTNTAGHAVFWLPDGSYSCSFSMSPGLPCTPTLVLGSSSSPSIIAEAGYAEVNVHLTRIYLTARNSSGTSFIAKAGTWTVTPGPYSIGVNGSTISPSFWLPNGSYSGSLGGALETGASPFQVGTPSLTGQRPVIVGP